MERHHYRSLFWPILLIGVGVIWLLSNLNIIDASTLNVLWQFWPVLLVLAGIDILFGRQWPWIGALIGLLTVAAIVVLLVAGPAVGINLPETAGGEQMTEEFSEPIGNASSASLQLDGSSYSVDLQAGRAADQLVNASITHHGQAVFEVSGETEKRVRIGVQENTPFGFFNLRNVPWEITLTDGVPWDIVLDGGSGSVQADLTNVDLRSLSGDVGSGSFDLSLPDTTQAYNVDMEGGSGSLNMRLPGQGDVDVRLDGGSGSLRLDAPSGAAVRLEVLNGGSGSVSVPNGMDKVEGGDDDDEGVWETDGYSSAESQINIVLEDLGSGSFSLN